MIDLFPTTFARVYLIFSIWEFSQLLWEDLQRPLFASISRNRGFCHQLGWQTILSLHPDEQEQSRQAALDCKAPNKESRAPLMRRYKGLGQFAYHLTWVGSLQISFEKVACWIVWAANHSPSIDLMLWSCVGGGWSAMCIELLQEQWDINVAFISQHMSEFCP